MSDFGDGSLARVVSFTKALDGSLRGRFHERINRFMPERPDAPASGDDHARPSAALGQSTVERLDDHSVPREILDEPFAGLAAAVDFFLGPELVSGRLPDGSHALCVYGFDYEWSIGQSL